MQVLSEVQKQAPSRVSKPRLHSLRDSTLPLGEGISFCTEFTCLGRTILLISERSSSLVWGKYSLKVLR